MTRYSDPWGDTLEVIEPVELREMVQGYQRGDVGMLP
jgi:hypothetical protein